MYDASCVRRSLRTFDGDSPFAMALVQQFVIAPILAASGCVHYVDVGSVAQVDERDHDGNQPQ